MTRFAHSHISKRDGDCDLYYEFIIDSILLTHNFNRLAKLLFGEFIIDKPTIRSYYLSYHFASNDMFVNLTRDDVDKFIGK